MSEKRFNIRVYGILVNEENHLLVMDELIRGIQFTKFPGGGLDWGEGTLECLHREFREELEQPIQVLDHFFTTDYFQASAFNTNDQLMSIYYRVRLQGPQVFQPKTRPFDFPDEVGNQYEVPRWIPMNALKVEDFTWPVDKMVVEMLLKDRKTNQVETML